MSRTWLLLTFIGLCVTHSSTCRAGDETELRETGLKKWSALDEAVKHLDTTFTLNESYIAGKPTIPIKYKLLVDDQSVLQQHRSPRKFDTPSLGDIERVLGRTPDYVYLLERKVGDKDYRLGNLGQDSPDFSKQLYMTRKARLISISIEGRSIIEWLGDSRFVVQSLSRVQQEGRNMIKLDARFTPEGEDSRTHHPALTAWFDEGEAWALRKYEAKAWYGTITATVDYGPPAGGAPRPLRLTEIRTYNEDRKLPKATSSIEFETWNPRTIEPEEFLISQFGLPEPQSVTPAPAKRSWLWVWLIAGAVVIGGVGITLVRRGRRVASIG